MNNFVFDTSVILAIIAGIFTSFGGILLAFFYVKAKTHKKPYYDVGEDMSSVIRHILDAKTSCVYIMGVTLRGFLGAEPAKCIESWIDTYSDIEIKVLLLNPNSVSAIKFFKSEDGISDIKDLHSSKTLLQATHTLRTMKKLQENNKNVEIRLYNELPYGLLLITDDFCIFQAYLYPESRRAIRRGMPIVVYNKEENKSDYKFYKQNFKDTWGKSLTQISDSKDAFHTEISKMNELVKQGIAQEA